MKNGQLKVYDDDKPFDDGLIFTFNKSKPEMLSFECKVSEDKDAEGCDLRLFFKKPC